MNSWYFFSSGNHTKSKREENTSGDRCCEYSIVFHYENMDIVIILKQWLG